MSIPADPSNALDGIQLLLVEDHPVNRDVALALLEPTNAQVDIALDGKQAVDKAASKPYDVILMDVQMPVMDGLDATRSIRRQSRNQATPIIAMTADAFAEDRARCVAAGMDDYIAKPFDPDDLLRLIRRWVYRLNEAPAKALAEPTPAAHPAPDSEGPGIDFSQGMLIAHGKLDRYQDLLRDFVRESARDIEQIRTQLAAGAAMGARRACHSLRGAAALVGAVRVQDCVQGLEQSIRSTTTLSEVENAIVRIEAERTAIADYLDTVASPSPSATPLARDDEARLLSVLANLAGLLRAGDMQSNLLMSSSASLIGAYLGETADTLRRQIETFDYEGAARTVQQALAERRR